VLGASKQGGWKNLRDSYGQKAKKGRRAYVKRAGVLIHLETESNTGSVATGARSCYWEEELSQRSCWR
jgi:hypothetical protein